MEKVRGGRWLVPEAEEVLARGSSAAIPVEDAALWQRFEELARVADASFATVLANVVALLVLDDDTDLTRTAELAGVHGRDQLARHQLRVLHRLGGDSARGLTERLVHRLAGGPAVPDPALTAACRTAMAALLLAEVEADPPVLRGPLPLRAWPDSLAGHGIDEWRPWLAALLVAPWGPVVAVGHDRARAAGEDVEGVVDAVVAVARDRVEMRERQAVADQVARLLGSTGLSQKGFASLVGTSASRLSTYVSGKVTPSAAMLLRMTRAARSFDAGTRATA